MDYDYKISNLCNSFEVLKDSWISKKTAIQRCIGEAIICEPTIGMDMWLYILQKNKKALKTEDGRSDLIGKIFFSISDAYGEWVSHDWRITRIYYSALINNRELNKLLYGSVFFSEDDYETNKSILLYSAAWLIIQGNPEMLDLTLQNLFSSQTKMKGYTIGNYIYDVIQICNEITRDFYIREENPSIQVCPEIKELLMSFVNSIIDEKERAVATIALVSLD